MHEQQQQVKVLNVTFSGFSSALPEVAMEHESILQGR